MALNLQAPLQELVVGVADLKESRNSNCIITTFALGSCLGVTCYDPINRVGGMLHAMLASARASHHTEPAPAMYLDTGVPALIQHVTSIGGNPRVFEYKIFGGAKTMQADEYFNIGNKNIRMMEEVATQLRLHVKVWEVGGQHNRTIKFNLKDGRVKLRMPNQPETFL
jgi:chemotaxis protein CheD